MTELECQSSQSPAIKSQKTELNQTIEELENTLRDKEEVCVCVRVFVCVYVHVTHPYHLFTVLQEMEKLKEELENMNDLMEQKDTLTQKLEVSEMKLQLGPHSLNKNARTYLKDTASVSPGDRAAQSGAGGAAAGCRAAAGGEPGGAGELQKEPADAAGDAGRQDLRADGAQRHLGPAHRGGQLETGLPDLHRQSHMIIYTPQVNRINPTPPCPNLSPTPDTH